MKDTERFIKDAMGGGWTPTGMREASNRVELDLPVENDADFSVHFYENWNDMKLSIGTALGAILLDPSAWKAVGKVRGWTLMNPTMPEVLMQNWRTKLHYFIDAVADGKTIEEALGTL